MNLNEFKSLVDLFFYQAKKQNPQIAFLEWLNPKTTKSSVGEKHHQIFIS
jgi:hypothetical protein